MFNLTMKTIGEIVKDDVKLGTLYTTLVMATPGEELSDEAKVASITVKKIGLITNSVIFLGKPCTSASTEGDYLANLQISQN